eukprot:s1136_g21.t1
MGEPVFRDKLGKVIKEEASAAFEDWAGSSGLMASDAFSRARAHQRIGSVWLKFQSALLPDCVDDYGEFMARVASLWRIIQETFPGPDKDHPDRYRMPENPSYELWSHDLSLNAGRDALDGGVPGPTFVDDDTGCSFSQQDGDVQVFPDAYSVIGSNRVECVDNNVLDTDSRRPEPDRDLSWLLDLGRESAVELTTDRLGPDTQAASTCSSHNLPGFGMDNSSWALRVDPPKFFWEADPFLSTVFGQGSVTGPELKRPAVDFDLTGREPTDVFAMLRKPKQVRVSGLCEQVIKHVEVRDERDKRQSVISNWSSLVCINLEAFAIGDTILAGGGPLTHAVVETSLKACFARKATSTLAKRFYALNRFVNYCGRNGLQFFPLREHVVFTFLQRMVEDAKAAASAGRSFLEACRFARGVLGLRGDMAELGTARVDGMAVELGKRAGPISQASPLLVSQVIALEKLVATTQDLKDRVAYGAMLVLLYSCGRFSDGQRAVNMILDVERSSIDHCAIDCPGFVELQVLGNKGARSDVLRRTYLPLVAPVYSLGSFAWFQAWIQAREILGLEISGKLTAPLLCRFGADGVPLQQEITSSECGKLLRRALRVDEVGSSGIRSHSLKATALSWAGKFGVGLETRRLLGHHLDANAKSAEAYNRDSMGPAVEQLVKTLQAIKQGTFKPDESRSGRFSKAADAAADGHDEQDAQTESDSDSSFVPDSDDSSDSDEFPFSGPGDSTLLWHLVAPQLRPEFVDIPETCAVYRNNASGVQHLKKHGNLRFLCGRRECDRYTFFSGKPIRGVALCEPCLHSKDLISESEPPRVPDS